MNTSIELHQNKTVEYYNKNAQTYCERTLKIDLTPSYEQFLKYLPCEAKILDAGSGAGRDTKKFLEAGYQVVAIDASKELVKFSTEYTSHKTHLMTFEEMDFESEFEGIWSMASLLHVQSENLLDIMWKMKRALKPNGVWFLSFKLGDFEGELDGRYFNFMTREKLLYCLELLGGLEILSIEELKSYESNTDVQWIQCLVRKEVHILLPAESWTFGLLQSPGGWGLGTGGVFFF